MRGDDVGRGRLPCSFELDALELGGLTAVRINPTKDLEVGSRRGPSALRPNAAGNVVVGFGRANRTPASARHQHHSFALPPAQSRVSRDVSSLATLPRLPQRHRWRPPNGWRNLRPRSAAKRRHRAAELTHSTRLDAAVARHDPERRALLEDHPGARPDSLTGREAWDLAAAALIQEHGPDLQPPEAAPYTTPDLDADIGIDF